MRRAALLAFGLVFSLLWTGVTLGAEPSAVRPARGELQRLAGPTRIETAAEISRSFFEPDVPLAFITTGERFPDALTGGPLAATIGAPILLTWAGELPLATAAELLRLRPRRILVLGGTAAVSQGVADALRAFTRPGAVERIAGPTRFETAAEIARQGFTAPVDIAFVATGLDYADALAGAAAGARLGGPVLLTATNHLPVAARDVLEELRPRRIVVLGGTAAVTDGVRNELGFYSSTVERWSGADRFATAARIASEAFTPAETTAALVATGADFPDALTGAAVAGLLRAPLLLTSRFQVPERLAQELTRLAPGGLDVFVLGGQAVISSQVADELSTYANPTPARLSGVVTDAVSAGTVAGAEVRLVKGDDVMTTTSGANGTFAFEDLVWGRFTVEVTHIGYARGALPADVEPGTSHRSDIALQRVTAISGRVVVIGSSQQVPGARVTAQRIAHDGTPTGPIYATVTDDDGRFLLSDNAFAGLALGRYWVEVTHDGYVASSGATPELVQGQWTEGVWELVRVAP